MAVLGGFKQCHLDNEIGFGEVVLLFLLARVLAALFEQRPGGDGASDQRAAGEQRRREGCFTETSALCAMEEEQRQTRVRGDVLELRMGARTKETPSGRGTRAH